MQRKLAKWSSEKKERKFDRLFRLTANPDWLMEATMITLRARGAKTAGVDGITKDDVEKKTSIASQEASLRN
jgi:retron-type reverse transcriptase